MSHTQENETCTAKPRKGTEVNLSYKLVEIDEIGNLTAGTQIAVKREFRNMDATMAYFYPLFSSDGYYYHHGVYLGNCKVVHFSGADKTNAKLGECDILKFCKNTSDGKLYIVEYDDPNSVLPVEETLEKAKTALENSSEWPGYHVVKNNCESFATWLKTGVMASAQAIEGVIRIIPLAVGGVAAGSLGVAASISSSR